VKTISEIEISSALDDIGEPISILSFFGLIVLLLMAIFFAGLASYVLQVGKFAGLFLTHSTMLLALIAWYRKRGVRNGWKYFLRFPSGWQLLIGLSTSVALYVVAELSRRIFGSQIEQYVLQAALLRDGSEWFFLLMVTLLIAPITEEIFFRLILMDFSASLLKKFCPGRPAIQVFIIIVILQASLFVMIHHQYQFLSTFSLLFILAISLGIARMACRSIWLPVAMHSFASVMVYLLQVFPSMV